MGTLTVPRGGACAPRLMSDGDGRTIGLASRQHGPDDPGGLVGHGHGNQPGWFALEQAADPVGSSGIGGPRASHHRCRADDEQLPEVAIPHLRDASQLVLAARRVLARDQAQRSRELPARTERCWISHRGSQGGGADDAYAWDGGQSLTCQVLTMPDQKALIERLDLPDERMKLFDQSNASDECRASGSLAAAGSRPRTSARTGSTTAAPSRDRCRFRARRAGPPRSAATVETGHTS